MATEKHRVQLLRWQALIQDRMNSGLKIREWCEHNHVSKDAYYYWLDQVRKEAVAQAGGSSPVLSESNAFVEIRPASSIVTASVPQNNAKTSAIIRRSGLEIELLDDASSSFIRQLLEAVRYA